VRSYSGTLLGIAGVFVTFYLLWFLRYTKKLNSVFAFRLSTLLFGASLGFTGLTLLGSERVPLSFASGFLVICGAQITLWTIGISLEILGNTPVDSLFTMDEEDPSSP
jgi:hypothetical protein